MHVADWYPTLCALAGVDAADDWIDPTTNTSHPIDGVDLWPVNVLLFFFSSFYFYSGTLLDCSSSPR
jgi:hypothetical protein